MPNVVDVAQGYTWESIRPATRKWIKGLVYPFVCRERSLRRALRRARHELTAPRDARALAAAAFVKGRHKTPQAVKALAMALDAYDRALAADFPFKPSTFFDFPWWLPPASIAFAALFAILGAWGPARRAARLSPAGALAGTN